MPPKRRSQGSRTASTGNQSTLSFHGKNNRVTKSGVPAHTKSSKKAEALAQDVVDIETLSDGEETTAEAAITQQAQQEAATLDTVPDPLDNKDEATTTEDVLGGRAQQSDLGALGGKGAGWAADEETEARKISDTQIKKYWRQKEQERLAPRVHQQDLTVYEKVLREWDMSNQYGVSIAQSRSSQMRLLTTYLAALHRHRTPQALEACQSPRTEAADGGPRHPAQGDGGWRDEVATCSC